MTQSCHPAKINKTAAAVTGASYSLVETMDPLWGIYCATTRQDEEDQSTDGWHPDEKIRTIIAEKTILGGHIVYKK